MKIDPRTLLGPLVGLVVLVLILQQTMGALRASGAWQPDAPSGPRAENPYARLDGLVSQAPPPRPEALRDPFGYGSASAPIAVVPRVPRDRSVPVEPAPPRPKVPTLTSIIWEESDPRATIRYDGRDFSVRVNSLFADFTVRSIRQNEVVLDRNGQSIVLTLRKGE